ncbi:MAG: hypothetical protein FWH27_09105 [Planctomycetaceae bacterium]|nr:hypothetical protein [Planctomycetaceae bacterium]
MQRKPLWLLRFSYESGVRLGKNSTRNYGKKDNCAKNSMISERKTQNMRKNGHPANPFLRGSSLKIIGKIVIFSNFDSRNAEMMSHSTPKPRQDARSILLQIVLGGTHTRQTKNSGL